MSPTPLRRDRGSRERVLRAVRPNGGLEAEYRRRLVALIEALHKSAGYWIAAAYRANPPRLAQDETSAQTLLRSIRELSKRWLAKFDTAAERLADYFATAVEKRSSAALKRILKDGGFSVEWTMTPEMRDVMQATIGQQVGLIKSIPAQYLTQVEGSVMRSVQTGRDLGTLAKELQGHYGVSKRRAAFIARSQNGIATASMTRVRQQQAGITEAIWVHSGGGREPRASHVKAGAEGVRYDVTKGWFDPHEKQWIWPGELPNCRCVSKAVVKGFT